MTQSSFKSMRKRTAFGFVALAVLLGLMTDARAQSVAWSQQPVNGPPSRFRHSMAYDSIRQTVVLFGGNRVSERVGDTWEWSGTSWTRRAQTGPSAREGSALVFDAARGVAVLFGGFSGN